MGSYTHFETTTWTVFASDYGWVAFPPQSDIVLIDPMVQLDSIYLIPDNTYDCVIDINGNIAVSTISLNVNSIRKYHDNLFKKYSQKIDKGTRIGLHNGSYGDLTSSIHAIFSDNIFMYYIFNSVYDSTINILYTSDCIHLVNISYYPHTTCNYIHNT